MNWNGNVINFLGDSITQGVGASSKETNYVSQTGEILNLAAANNYGISATRIAPRKISMDPKIDSRWFATRVPEMDPDADGIVVFGGTNDFGHGDAPMGTPEDRTEDTFWGACHVLCEKLINRFPKAQIVFMSPLHRENEENAYGSNKPEPVGTLYDYVEVIKTVTRRFAIPFLDMLQVSGLTPIVPVYKALYMPDGLHPNDAGHEKIAQRLKGFLVSL